MNYKDIKHANCCCKMTVYKLLSLAFDQKEDPLSILWLVHLSFGVSSLGDFFQTRNVHVILYSFIRIKVYISCTALIK